MWLDVPLVQSDGGFFDHQYLEKEWIDILVILHGGGHQGSYYQRPSLKCHTSIKMKVFSIISISGKNQSISKFFYTLVFVLKI